MKTYSVTVSVVFSQFGRYEVEASSEEEATKLVQGMLDSGEIDDNDLELDGDMAVQRIDALDAEESE